MAIILGRLMDIWKIVEAASSFGRVTLSFGMWSERRQITLIQLVTKLTGGWIEVSKATSISGLFLIVDIVPRNSNREPGVLAGASLPSQVLNSNFCLSNCVRLKTLLPFFCDFLLSFLSYAA